jgi:hypothetical protein
MCVFFETDMEAYSLHCPVLETAPYPVHDYVPSVFAAIRAVFLDPENLPVEGMAGCIDQQVVATYADMLAINAYGIYALNGDCDIWSDAVAVVHDLVRANIVCVKTCAPNQLCLEWYGHKLREGNQAFSRARPTHTEEFVEALQARAMGDDKKNSVQDRKRIRYTDAVETILGS